MCPVGARLLGGPGGFLDRGEMVCHCLLIESDDGLVLVDTGIGLEDVADPENRLGKQFTLVTSPRRNPELTAAHQIEKLGYKRSDVRHIVVTHLDLDHAGGLPDFPEAQVHIFEPEHNAAMARATYMERERYRPCHWAHQPRWVKHRVEGERWMGFEAVRTLDKDSHILLVPLVGHTRGHCGVAVDCGSEWLLHAGDAYFFRSEVSPSSPYCPVGLTLFQRFAEIDHEARIWNQERLRNLNRAHGHNVRIFCAHDPVEFERMAS